ncbi:hypothetical protein WJX81_003948 [Elliptochloris bilobata]|uniref:Long-chain-fatty-acid--CoA ligase n=1 Tax=Elliptochloris bilobata TaxID=381761 RepID=A0AAW1R3M7_9CHLO
MAPHKYGKLVTEVEPATPARGGKPAYGPVYRNVTAREGYPTLEGITTLYELFSSSAAKYPDNPCLGHRPQVDGKALSYDWLTYREVGDLVDKVASGLVSTGLQPKDKVAVYGSNAPEWMIAMQACNRQGYFCVPLYDTLGENAVEYIISHSETSALFASADKLPTLAKALPKLERGQVRTIVYWGTGAAKDAGFEKACSEAGITAHTWAAFLALGAAKPAKASPPAPGDLCTIMYTSGTTGDPKGVMLKHSAVVAVVAGILAFLNQVAPTFGANLSEKDVMLSYLPLAHIFDRSAEEMFLSVGGRIGYFQGDPRKLVDDIGELKPTIFLGVPRVFDRIYAGVLAKIKEAGGVKALLYSWGFRRKAYFLAQGARYNQASPFFDKLVFSKIKARLGGRVNLILSGGAPLAGHVEEFLKVAMCAPVVQGYGLTETCAASFIGIPDDKGMSGTVGPALPCVSLRLEAVLEMNYDPSATPPRGEVCLHGPTLFSGYYKDKEKTDEVLDEDGWFHTGDIGELAPDGALKIIDRKKNIFKLSQGEYIAVEKVEAVYKKNSLVEQIWVYGNSFENVLVAVVVPNEAALAAWAEKSANGAAGAGDFAALCRSDAARKHVLAELTATGKEGRLKGFEAVKAINLEPQQFTVEDELMTPTFKLKRPQLQKKYQGVLDAMYRSRGDYAVPKAAGLRACLLAEHTDCKAGRFEDSVCATFCLAQSAETVTILDARDALETCGELTGRGRESCFAQFGCSSERVTTYFAAVEAMERAYERDEDGDEDEYVPDKSGGQLPNPFVWRS